MNKFDAIKRILEIQSGRATPIEKFPKELAGSLFLNCRRNPEVDDAAISYGFEYGEIYGLMESFDIQVDEIKNFEIDSQKREARKECTDNSWHNHWNELAECSRCKAKGHYTFTAIGDYSYPETFYCKECGRYNAINMTSYFLPANVVKSYQNQIDKS